MVLGHEVNDRAADHLRPGIAEDLAFGPVEVDDPPLEVDLVIPERGLVVEPAELLFRIAEGPFGLLPIAGVGDERKIASNSARLVAIDVNARLDRHDRAVLAPVFLLVADRLSALVQLTGAFKPEAFQRSGVISSTVIPRSSSAE